MSIQRLTRDAALALPLQALDSVNGAPRSATELQLPGREKAEFGIWESEPGRFQRTVEEGEIMVILSGYAVFTGTDGQRTEMAEGDTLMFPPMTKGEWVVEKKLRKLYVLL
ncbi:DUF861 domain-containing protein [Xylophilus rhododendri]|uniref:DUF861 domain-containing protein n=1 Tax=Xylophilus rhododendri TaxID=2697032 RepID=A0A857J7U2_9BURK|nr:cupin domain-containing protein [Xylophilus rhododendri]QHI99139.1 DUF861 domain-containing protein [Xylophilus rhododendri]